MSDFLTKKREIENQQRCLACPHSVHCTKERKKEDSCEIHELEEKRKDIIMKINKLENPDMKMDFPVIITASCNTCKYIRNKKDYSFCGNFFNRTGEIEKQENHLCRKWKIDSYQIESAIKNRSKEENFIGLFWESNVEQLKRMRQNHHKKGWEKVQLSTVITRINKNLLETIRIFPSKPNKEKLINSLSDIANYAAMGIYYIKKHMNWEDEIDSNKS